MSRAILLMFLFGIAAISSRAQEPNQDSLFRIIDQLPADSNAFRQLLEYTNKISFRNPGKGFPIDQRILNRARTLDFTFGEVQALNSLGEDYHFLGNFAGALGMQLEALNIFRDLHDLQGQVTTLGFIGILYNELGEYHQALYYLFEADSIFRNMQGSRQESFTLANISNAYEALGNSDSAYYYAHEAYQQLDKSMHGHLRSFILGTMGSAYASVGKTDSALILFHAVIQNALQADDQLNLLITYGRIAKAYYVHHNDDSSFFYARKTFHDAKEISSLKNMYLAANQLADLFQQEKEIDSANAYLRISAALKDSLYGPNRMNQMQILLLNEQQRQTETRQQELNFKNQVKYISLFVALGIFLLAAFILFRSNRNKQKANNILQQQKKKIEETLAELKSAQAQLVQSEKMASLGELTAGIAHEIQNPLNFVNNFADINSELIGEMRAALNEGNQEELLSLSENLDKNMQKIAEHGRRADSIVKGMLQHSRISVGQKESTDFNALCDEYLRLAFHGMRAKDKLFNAEWKTNLDPAIGKIQIIPQDMGRVLLNLFNNAFYAVSQRAMQAPEGYSPLINVSTKKEKDHVLISVRDNGTGIPDKFSEKIFQPFFTTKPSGQGTGLGLSISYDIVRAHGGDISLKSKEGEGAEFVITLPI